MTGARPARAYYRAYSTADTIADGLAVWTFYEFDHAADTVLRDVAGYADGRIERNSLELEQRHGGFCPSLIDCPIAEAFRDAPLEAISKEDFEMAYAKGKDTPFWFPLKPR